MKHDLFRVQLRPKGVVCGGVFFSKRIPFVGVVSPSLSKELKHGHGT